MFQYSQISCFRFLSLISVLIILYLAPQTDANDLPPSKLSQTVGPHMKILYCYSCGYRKAYEEYTHIVQDRYPYMIIDGKNYDPPGFNMFLSRLIGLLKMAVICCILGGINIFHYINQPQPSWWSWCVENKIYACMMFFFLCNIVEGQLIHSGAFEIFLNDLPIWSKLETGRLPQPAELFNIIESNLQFSKGPTVEFNTGLPN